MIAAVTVAWACLQSVVLHHDDGRSAGPNDYSAVLKPQVTLKELARFDSAGRTKITGLRVFVEGDPGLLQVHFWKDIDSSVRPYVPFRHFEFDVVPPVTIRVGRPEIGHWVTVPLGANGFTMEPGGRVFVGRFVHQSGPQIGCDEKLDAPSSSVVETYDTGQELKKQESLTPASGDFMVRLMGHSVAPDNSLRFKAFLKVSGEVAGLAWADVDGDGFEDLLVNGTRLYRNLKGRGFQFVGRVGEGLSQFGVFGDFDNDGDQDLFQARGALDSPNQLLLNPGRGKFARSDRITPNEKLYSRSACWFDFDRDGRLDLFVADGAEFGDLVNGSPSRLYRNDGTKLVAVWPEMFTHGVKPAFASVTAAGDLDGDGIPELFVGTYRLEPDQLWSFRRRPPADVAAKFGIARTISPSGRTGGGNALGATMADVDNDGDLDLIVDNLLHPDWRGFLGGNESLLFENLGGMNFRLKRLRDSGVDYEESPANVLLEDFDDDGRLDLFHHSMYHSANLYAWRDGKWDDRAATAGIRARKRLAGAACDFDHDGRVDLAVADDESGLIIYRNVSPGGSWLEIQLRGNDCNRDAVGAIARVRMGNQTLTRSVMKGRGLACQDSAILHFGLGNQIGPFKVEVAWPCGRHQTIGPVAPGRRILVVEGDSLRYTES